MQEIDNRIHRLPLPSHLISTIRHARMTFHAICFSVIRRSRFLNLLEARLFFAARSFFLGATLQFQS
jgi:hypothetical protein